MLEIEIIHTPEELENTAKISVKYELWGTENMPETYAKMGYILHDVALRLRRDLCFC